MVKDEYRFNIILVRGDSTESVTHGFIDLFVKLLGNTFSHLPVVITDYKRIL